MVKETAAVPATKRTSGVRAVERGPVPRVATRVKLSVPAIHASRTKRWRLAKVRASGGRVIDQQRNGIVVRRNTAMASARP